MGVEAATRHLRGTEWSLIGWRRRDARAVVAAPSPIHEVCPLANWIKSEGIYNALPIPLQNACVAWRGWRIYRERFGREHDALMELFEAFEHASPEEHRAYQETRLRKLIHHAYETVPYYRRVMDERGLRPSDIRSAADLRKLPVITKDDVRQAGDTLVSSTVNPDRLRVAWTSATSSSPLPVRWDRAVALVNHASYMRVRRWAGVPFGRPYASMQGKPVVPISQKRPPFWRHNPLWNQVLFSAIALSNESLPHYVKKMRRSKVEMLETYPSCAYVMARFLEDRGEHLPLTCLLTTGEPLLPDERAVIEERFQAPVFDAYGQAERVVFSSECEKHEGHHVYPEYGLTELLDGDGNEVSAGEFGSVVGTGLHNFAMPLIRYACGDVASHSDKACSCGRTLPMFGGLTSREADILVAPDGRMVPPIMVGWIVKILEGVTNWQVIQESTTELHVLVVREQPVTEEEMEGVKGYVSRRLSPEVNVRVDLVDEIPRGRRGKSRHVVSRVPLVWGVPNRSPGIDGDA
ncbi:MAG: hypothetical protein ABIG03_02890 [Candidatus Eisenbacteria bacterium]